MEKTEQLEYSLNTPYSATYRSSNCWVDYTRSRLTNITEFSLCFFMHGNSGRKNYSKTSGKFESVKKLSLRIIIFISYNLHITISPDFTFLNRQKNKDLKKSIPLELPISYDDEFPSRKDAQHQSMPSTLISSHFPNSKGNLELYNKCI